MKIRQLITLSLLIGGCTCAFAQSTTTSANKYFNIQKVVIPPNLRVVDNSLRFQDDDGNNVINANERCKIHFQISNQGKGNAVGCEVLIKGVGSTAGLAFDHLQLPTIAAGATQTIELPVTTDMDTQNGTVTFTIEVTEPNGFGIEPMNMTVNTRAFESPLVKIVDYTINGENTAAIQRKEAFELSAMLQNMNSGDAKEVLVQLTVPAGVSLLDGNQQVSFPVLKGGEHQLLAYQLIVSNNYTESTLPLQIQIKESTGKFAENRTITLQISQTGTPNTSVTVQGQSSAPNKDIEAASLQRGGASVFGGAAGGAAAVPSNVLQSVTVTQPFAMVKMSSVLATYKNEFASMEMKERDDSFPYALFRVHITGSSNAIRVAKQTLLLYLGQAYQIEKMITSYDNQILFLISRNVRNVFITCGDGCLRQQIYSGHLETNAIYEGTVEVK